MPRSSFITGLLAGTALLLAACGAIVSPAETTSEQVVVIETETEPNQASALESVSAKTETAKSEAMTAQTQTEGTGPTAAQMRLLDSLPNNGPAPELLNDTFLNSEFLRLADLRGQVVIIEFWTYG